MKKIIQSQEKFNFMKSVNDFVRYLDKEESDRNSYKKVRQKTSFAPSGLGYGHGRCPRYWYYAFEGAEFDQHYRATDIRNMNNGTAVHERFQDFLEELDMAVDIEPVAEYDDPPIYGFIDGIVEWQGRTWVIEFKTTRDSAFKSRKEQLKPPSYHLVQILVYMYIKNIRQGMLVYENKDNQQRCAIAVEWNSRYGEYVEKLFDWMRTVHNSVTGEDRILPTRNFKKTGGVCTNCPVRNICWSDEEGDEKLKSLPTIKV